jgi:hypothetical protein
VPEVGSYKGAIHSSDTSGGAVMLFVCTVVSSLGLQLGDSLSKLLYLVDLVVVFSIGHCE